MPVGALCIIEDNGAAAVAAAGGTTVAAPTSYAYLQLAPLQAAQTDEVMPASLTPNHRCTYIGNRRDSYVFKLEVSNILFSKIFFSRPAFMCTTLLKDQ